jgi:hypothetical protein
VTDLEASLERKTVRASLATRAFLVFIGVLVGLVVVLQLNTTLLIRHDQEAGQQRAKDTNKNTDQIKQLAETIKSCTDPAGQCFKDGQARTGEAVASINEVIIYAAACADRPGVDSPPEIRNCIRDLLALHPNPLDVTR